MLYEVFNLEDLLQNRGGENLRKKAKSSQEPIILKEKCSCLFLNRQFDFQPFRVRFSPYKASIYQSNFAQPFQLF